MIAMICKFVPHALARVKRTKMGHFDGEATVASADRHFPVRDFRTVSEAPRQLELAGERGGVPLSDHGCGETIGR
jgi:hypothetical protein